MCSCAYGPSPHLLTPPLPAGFPEAGAEAVTTMVAQLSTSAHAQWASSDNLIKLTRPVSEIVNDFMKAYAHQANLASQAYFIANKAEPYKLHARELLLLLNNDADTTTVLYVKLVEQFHPPSALN